MRKSTLQSSFVFILFFGGTGVLAALIVAFLLKQNSSALNPKPGEANGLALTSSIATLPSAAVSYPTATEVFLDTSSPTATETLAELSAPDATLPSTIAASPTDTPTLAALPSSTRTPTSTQVNTPTLLPSPTQTRAPTQKPTAAPPPPPRGSPFGIAVLNTSNAAYFAQAKAAGARWVRLIVSWEEVEPVRTDPPTYNWARADAMFANAANAGLDPTVVIMNNPQWAVQTLPMDPQSANAGAHIKNGPTDPGALPAFAQFVQALAQRYKNAPYNVHYWEVYNEPDGTDAPASAKDPRGWFACWVGGCWGASAGKYWAGSPSGPALYAQMLKAVYPALKAGDPQGQLVLGALAFDQFQNDIPGCNAAYRDGGWYNYCFLQQVLAAGGGNYVDVMNFHYYVFMHDRWDSRGSGMLGKLAYLRSIVSTFGLVKPFMCTEIGVQSSEDLQARYAPQELTRVYASGVLGAIWFTLDPFDRWELVRADGGTKPAYRSYQVAAQQLAGYALSGPFAPGEGIEGYAFTNGAQTKWVLWVKWYPEGSAGVSGTRTVTFDANSVLVTDRFGSTTTIAGQNGKTSLQVDQNPIYVSPGP